MELKYKCGCTEKVQTHKDGLEVIHIISICHKCSDKARDRSRRHVSATTIYFAGTGIFEVKHALVVE